MTGSGRWGAPDDDGQWGMTAPDDGEHHTMASTGRWRAPDNDCQRVRTVPDDDWQREKTTPDDDWHRTMAGSG